MIEQRPFGRTGHRSSATLFGGAALGRVSQAEADSVLDILLEYGINHIDTAASYGDSELRIGPWMADHRDRFFLATKTGKRTYEEAKAEIDNSLKRLQVEQIDLIQLHNLVHPDEWTTAASPGGALEAAVEARADGKVRFIGVTGHGLHAPAMHRRSLEKFEFDSVLLPYNYPMIVQDQYAADFEALVRLCEERNVAVQTIKSITRGPWATHEQNRTTWYEPLEEQDDIDTAVNWVLGRPNFFLNTAGDTTLLPRVLNAASRLGPRPTDTEMDELVRKQKMTRLFT